jgi:predicted NAD/FAD-binding protein
MRAFPRLSLLYEAWKSLVETEGRGAVQIVTNREVTHVRRLSKNKGGVEAWSRSTRGTDNNQVVIDPGEEVMETYDELVICTDADAALKMLGNDATWLERRILGNVKVYLNFIVLWSGTDSHGNYSTCGT